MKDMSLRDYFATQALVGMGTWHPPTGGWSGSRESVCKVKASWAYAQADAMLAAREVADGVEYVGDAVEAVQRLLERGKAYVDSSGFLRTVPEGGVA